MILQQHRHWGRKKLEPNVVKHRGKLDLLGDSLYVDCNKARGLQESASGHEENNSKRANLFRFTLISGSRRRSRTLPARATRRPAGDVVLPELLMSLTAF